MKPEITSAPDLTLGVIAIDLNDLADNLAQKVVLALAKESQSPWMDVEAAAKHLACSPERLRKLVQRQSIPFHRERRGGRVFFHRDELDRWLLSQ